MDRHTLHHHEVFGFTNHALAELTLAYERSGLRLVVGRQGYLEGAPPATGVAPLDELARAKLAERLVGGWDWTQVGRRYDGLSFSLARERAHLAGFALRPLAGGVDHDDAFERLDHLTVYGLAVAAPYGAWLERSAVRCFVVGYEDERPGARAAARGELDLVTAGASLVAGDEANALLGWVAWQGGDWGASDHRAWAFVLGTSHRFGALAGEPTLYLGWEQASGDAAPAAGAHRSFFNLLPTNHKFYGSLDYSAFSNLRDLVLEGRWRPLPRLGLTVAVHDFALGERADAWYGGSGAFDAGSLGYQARRPAAGRFTSRSLGRELDLELALALPRKLELRAGGGVFDGGEAAREVLPLDADGSWVFLEIGWKR